MNRRVSKRQLSELGPILETKRRRVEVADHANQDQHTPTDLLSSQGQQQESIPSSSQDQQQRAATEVAPITTATVTTAIAPRSDNIHANKPEPCGRPPAFADKRGQLADALPFNKNHEGFLHTVDNVAKGMVLDAATSPRIMITDSVIITTM